MKIDVIQRKMTKIQRKLIKLDEICRNSTKIEENSTIIDEIQRKMTKMQLRWPKFKYYINDRAANVWNWLAMAIG